MRHPGNHRSVENETVTASTPAPAALARVAGLELASFRSGHVAERIRRALRRERVDTVDGLVQLLVTDPAARLRFRRSIAVPFTGLFRDPEQFERVDRDVLPTLVARGGTIRVWSAGAADGSELYSVALLLDRRGALNRARLLGSDLLDENVAAARRAASCHGVVSDRVRGRVRFERRDIVRDGAPAGAWDVVLCRNVAIYLEPGARDRLHRTLAGALAPGGTLVLGRSESLPQARALGLGPAGAHCYARAA
jgi:chemotaxis protein methyltransferase CheR